MGPPSFMRSVVDRCVVMRRIPVLTHQWPSTSTSRKAQTQGKNLPHDRGVNS